MTRYVARQTHGSSSNTANMRVSLLTCAVWAFIAFLPAPVLPSAQVRRGGAANGIQMQFFGKKPATPPAGAGGGQGGLAQKPGLTVVTWLPSGVQSYAKPGQRLGDAAQQAGLNVPYGCKEGVCGTCEAFLKQPNGMKNDVRICKDIVPKNNMETDREKMWGDLRGGKKSLSELQSAPTDITITLSNPGLALKRQQSWEVVKEATAKNTDNWLDPNYKGPSGGGAAPAKKGWNPFGR